MGMRIAGLILAGGRGTRMGGADKGLLAWGSHHFVDAALARLQPQVHLLAISANRNASIYAQRGLPVLADSDPHAFDGPLAGVLAGMAYAQAANCDWLQIVPCDNPDLPVDLCQRLLHSMGTAQGAYPLTTSGPEPAHALLPVSATADVQALWRSGQRSLLGMLRALQAAPVAWPETDSFRNLNHPSAGQP